jgi:hypothetical protein
MLSDIDLLYNGGGGIENGCFGNFLYPFELRRIAKNANDFQLLFGFIWFYLVLENQSVLYPRWHKYGTPTYSRSCPHCDHFIGVSQQ